MAGVKYSMGTMRIWGGDVFLYGVAVMVTLVYYNRNNFKWGKHEGMGLLGMLDQESRNMNSHSGFMSRRKATFQRVWLMQRQKEENESFEIPP